MLMLKYQNSEQKNVLLNMSINNNNRKTLSIKSCYLTVYAL